jgi:putative tricarboxylic transport membrane protein
MVFFGVIGYLMRKTGFEPAPMVFTYILCPIWEESFRQSLIVSYGDIAVFFKRPISATLLAIAFLFLLSPIVASKKRKKLMEKISETAG